VLIELQIEQMFNFKKSQKNLLIVILTATFVANVAILLVPSNDTKNLLGDIFRPIAAGSAVPFGLLIVYRQKLHGLFGRAYLALLAGITCWFIAETIWGIYQFVLNVPVPTPSIADGLWLAGYGGYGYFMFSMARFYSRFKKSHLVIAGAAVAIFSAFYINAIVSASDLTGPNGPIELAITIAYPVLDGILIVPAVLVVFNSRKGQLTAIPWIFIFWILTTVADSLYGYTVVVNIAGVLSVWNLVYVPAYLCMAAGMYWYNKFFIVDEKKLAELWKKASDGQAGKDMK